MDGKRKRIASSQSSNGRPNKTRSSQGQSKKAAGDLKASQQPGPPAVLKCSIDPVERGHDGMTAGDFTLRLAFSEDELTADDRRVIVKALKGSRMVCGVLEERHGVAKAKGYPRSAARGLGPLVQRLPAVAEGQVLPEGTVLFLPVRARAKYYVLERTVCTKTHVRDEARVLGHVTERMKAFTFILCDGTCEGEPNRFCDCENESDCECDDEATCRCDDAGETTCECVLDEVRFEGGSGSPATGEATSSSESFFDSESD
ncbi:uncharacterized protein LOC113204670 [Frankliniella occidentalis]|uniref:Uncharacterized protein LOC113204670 n=1 Tax=Frankliniella occidentalis TaxID=133901 RepID=A0A6J1S3B8_FRAOC|nr:uncharacterized protein LOC113204670 [Frankliniella occidentalis]